MSDLYDWWYDLGLIKQWLLILCTLLSVFAFGAMAYEAITTTVYSEKSEEPDSIDYRNARNRGLWARKYYERVYSMREKP